MSYQDDLKRHLAEYKRTSLNIAEPGIFRYRGRDLTRDHILPLAQCSRNLFEEAEPAARAFLASNPSKRHRYFHHLNSSQAFVFNLFFPYFSGGPESSSALLHALGQEGVLDKWEPEAVPVPEEETNIDMLWTTQDGTTTFCEVKLSEAGFGKADDDERHRAKLANWYGDTLMGHLDDGRLERLAFFKAYQFNRNVWHMLRVQRSRLIFLLPKANAKLWSQLQKLLSGILPDTRGRISAIAIEDVLASLVHDSKCPETLREYAKKLSHKYLCTEIAPSHCGLGDSTVRG